MHNIEELKRQIRDGMSRMRATLQPVWIQAASKMIAGNLCRVDRFAASSNVGCYLAASNEAQTAGILAYCWDRGKHVFVPACVPYGQYRFARLGRGQATTPGQFGIPEPAEHDWIDVDKLDVIVVPGVAFDKGGRRLGHGGGHFDRLLAGFGGLRIGLAFESQVVEEIPAAEHDVPVDLVVTELNIYAPEV